MPSPSWWEPMTFSWVRRSHFCDARSVKGWQIESSQWVSSPSPRTTIVTVHAERGEHVRELRGDEATADDHQMLGQFRDPHDVSLV